MLSFWKQKSDGYIYVFYTECTSQDLGGDVGEKVSVSEMDVGKILKDGDAVVGEKETVLTSQS